MYVHYKVVERIVVVGKMLAVGFLTPHLLGLNMNPNRKPLNIQRSFTLHSLRQQSLFLKRSDPLSQLVEQAWESRAILYIAKESLSMSAMT